MGKKKEISRRTFLTKVAAGGAACAIVPRHVLGRGFTPPSDTLNIAAVGVGGMGRTNLINLASQRSEEHTSELQSRLHLVCRLLLEKKKKQYKTDLISHKNPITVPRIKKYTDLLYTFFFRLSVHVRRVAIATVAVRSIDISSTILDI